MGSSVQVVIKYGGQNITLLVTDIHEVFKIDVNLAVDILYELSNSLSP
jgi:hypothetical protein